MNQPEHGVCRAVDDRISSAAEHEDREADDRAEDDGAQRDQQGRAGAGGKELPAALLDEGVLEVILHAREETELLVVFARYHHENIAGVVHVRQAGILVSLIAEDDVQTDVIFAGFRAGCDGFKGYTLNVRCVAVFAAKPIHEVHIIAAVSLLVDVRKRLVAALAGDDQLTVLAAEAALFGLAGFRIEILDPVVIHFVEHAVTVAVVSGNKFVHLR